MNITNGNTWIFVELIIILMNSRLINNNEIHAHDDII